MKINLKTLLIILIIVAILIGIIVFACSIYFKETKEITPLPGVLLSDAIPPEDVSIENKDEGEYDFSDNTAHTLKAVVVGKDRINDKVLDVAQIKNNEITEHDLLRVRIPDDIEFEFKRGQEVLIYYNGIIAASFPGQVTAGKIEVSKEESDFKLSENILRRFYSSILNVNVEPLVITNKGIEITIIDTNEVPFEYSNTYRLNKKEKNPEYPRKAEFVEEATDHSTSAYTGTGTEFIYKEAPTISDMFVEDTVEQSKNQSGSRIDYKIDWSGLYGELEEGEYQFILYDVICDNITYEFTVDSNGKAELINKNEQVKAEDISADDKIKDV